MISFLLTAKRLLTGVFHAFKMKNFQALLILIIIMLLSGTIFYSREEGLSVVDALYFCVTTLSTVGHPNYVPSTAFGKIFTMLYIFVGTGLFLSLVGHIAYGVILSNQKDGDVDENMGRDRFKKKAKQK